MELSIRGTSLGRAALYGAATYMFLGLPLMAQRVEKPQASQVQSAAAAQTGNQANSDGKPLGVLPVLGKGTTNAIPVWTGTYTIGNSILSQSGGTLTVSGSVSARTFMGDGSAVTNVNANLLDGLSSSAFVQAGASNTFTGDQTITGNLNVSGFFNNALYLQGNLTDSEGQQGANVLGGFTGVPGFPGNSIAPGVIGATIAGGGGVYFPTARVPQMRPTLKLPNGKILQLGRELPGDHPQEASSSAMPGVLTAGGNVVQLQGNFSTIGGGLGNTVGATYATIAGGETNVALGAEATIGGGTSNTASGADATVSGGLSNVASATGASVGGGATNSATAVYSTVAGGSLNMASGQYSVASGGSDNSALGDFSAILGGSGNLAQGAGATILAGWNNSAQADYTFAAGCGSSAANNGSFVWTSEDPELGCELQGAVDTAPAQFVVQAAGGFYFWTGPHWTSSIGATLPSGSGSWSSMSDRNTKANFAVVDTSSLLAKIAALPLSTWNYKAQAETIRHLGPMAQDFRAAFGLGEDDKHISTIDSEGVSLAGIQALYKLSQEKDQKIAELSRTVEDLMRRLAAIEAARQ